MNLSIDPSKNISAKTSPPPRPGEAPGNADAKPRVESLDYLRGVLALGVMLYHYRMWNGITGGYPMEQFFQRIGIYAVGTFYVLSGTSLGIVYGRRRVDREFLMEFAVKRLFRIAPLFWVATTLTIVIRWMLIPWLGLSSGGVPPHHLPLALLNYSLLFGWIRPDLYIAGGAWSIGNELVFYSLFPGLLVLMRASRAGLLATFSAMLAIGMVFAFWIIKRNGDLDGEQWETYVNPLNHAFLFTAGIALAIVCRGQAKPPLKWLLAIVVLSLAMFIFWPARGRGETVMVTGYERLFYSGLSFVFCYVALMWHGGYGRFASTLVWIGNISYAVYLLHPILFSLLEIFNARFLHANASLVSFGLALPATILSAMISWRLLEKPMMRVGRRLSGGGVPARAVLQPLSPEGSVLCSGQ